jgi:hypothetical protein
MPANFPLGQTVITPNARDNLNPDDVQIAIQRDASDDGRVACAFSEYQAGAFGKARRSRPDTSVWK